jgi:predicted nucleotidyltransferase
MTDQESVLQRYQRALDVVVAQLQEDYYVLAAVLYGSLARGDAWEKSDIDLTVVLRDGQERASRELWITVDEISIFAILVTRQNFKRYLDGELQGGIGHSIRSQSRLLFSKDPSIEAWLAESSRVGAHDQAYQLLQAVSGVPYLLKKAEKWLAVKHDPDYCFLWLLFAANSLARVEVLLNNEAPSRETLQQALAYNPAFFRSIYTDLIHAPKTEARLRQALAAIDAYLLERQEALFKPVFDFLSQAEGPVTLSELHAHFRKKVPHGFLGEVYEWLADHGFLQRLDSPIRLTRKSTITLSEPAYYYEREEEVAEWE